MPESSQLASPLHVVALIPLCDDWLSAGELLRQLDQALSAQPYLVDILLVDDGSIEVFRSEELLSRFVAIKSIRILRLRRNLGHQRAIAIGLVHIQKSMPCDAV